MSDIVKRLPEKVRQHTQFIYERASGINLSIWSEMANDFLSAADRIEALEGEVARLRVALKATYAHLDSDLSATARRGRAMVEIRKALEEDKQ